MMVDILKTLMTAFVPEDKTSSTAKSKQNPKNVTSAYEADAQELINGGDTNGSGALSRDEIMALSPLKSTAKKSKVAETLFFGKESGGLGVQEVAQLLAAADTNRDGKLSEKERNNTFAKMLNDLDQGKSVEETRANQWARELKAGVRFSNAKLEKAEELFEKYEIPKSRFTPPTTDEVITSEDDTEKTGWQAMLPTILSGVTGLFNQPKNRDTSNTASPTLSADTSKALDPSTSQATLDLAKQAASLGVPSLGTTSPLGGTPLLSAALPTPTLAPSLSTFNTPLMTAGTNTALPMLQNPTFPTATPVLMPSAAATLPASGAWNPAVNTTPNTAWNVAQVPGATPSGTTPFSFTPSAGLPAGTSWGTPPPVMLASTANPQYKGGW
ncbi:MAG: hypothetical protein HEQ32_07495 [Vampirovibrio sp.]